MSTAVFILLAYLLGSISFAVVVSKLFDLPDPHTYGSGNPGATNVLRTGKKAAAALTLLGDGAKGWLAVWLAQHFSAQWPLEPWGLAAVALAVFLGHLFPLYHRFAGGKGVATAAGIMLALNMWLGLAVFGIWLFVAVVLKISSLAALVAALTAPPLAFWLLGDSWEARMMVPLALLLIWRHRSNIRQLLAGKEATIGR